MREASRKPSADREEAAPPLARETLAQQILAGHRPEFFSADIGQEIRKWAQEMLASGEPYEATMAGRQPRKLNHLKLMYGTPDQDGLLPMYNFGIAIEDLRKTAPMPELLHRVARELLPICGGIVPNNCLANIYRDGSHDTSKHQHQRFSLGDGQYESRPSVFFARFGDARPLAFHPLSGGDTIADILVKSRDLYELTGPRQRFLPSQRAPCARLRVGCRPLIPHCRQSN